MIDGNVKIGYSMITLKDEVLEVTQLIKAEIIKIVGQDDQINYMWRRDPPMGEQFNPIS